LPFQGAFNFLLTNIYGYQIAFYTRLQAVHIRAIQATKKDLFGKFTTLIGIGLADTELHARVQVRVVIA
jgi:hypothetical protein